MKERLLEEIQKGSKGVKRGGNEETYHYIFDI